MLADGRALAEAWWHDRFEHRLRLAVVLGAITLLAGFLRFWRLGQQSFWVDEVFTVQRICVDFTRIAELLKEQGFPPGWYVALWAWLRGLIWLFGDVRAFDPGLLRTLPALAGTLMPLAMYWLARAFLDRRGAVLVALLAAVNPYFIYYSRDLKMYMTVWLMLTVHLRLLLQWLESPRQGWWWPLWLLSGVICTALHSLVWLVVPVELLWLLTRPRIRGLDAPLWLLGVAVMALLPVWWYQHVSQWIKVFENKGSLHGLEWIKDYMRMDWNALASLPCVHLLGFVIPHYPPDAITTNWFDLGSDFKDHLATRGHALLAQAQMGVIGILAGLVVLGLFPWRGRAPRRAGQMAAYLPLRQRSALTLTAGRWWWVGVWIILPVVVLGIGSLRKPGLFLYWPGLGAWWWQGGMRYVAAAVLAWLMAGVWCERRGYLNLRRKILWIALPAAVLALGGLLMWGGWRLCWPPHKLAWEPRYLGIICPAFILTLAVLLRRLPTWPVRMAAILLVLGASVASASSNYLIYRQTPWERLAQTAVRYYSADKPRAVALGFPRGRYTVQTDWCAFLHAMGIKPTPENIVGGPVRQAFQLRYEALSREHAVGGKPARKVWQDARGLSSVADSLDFLQSVSADKTVQVIVLADKDGDLPEGPLGNAATAALLPGWLLISEGHYRQYYEWHYFIDHDWRVRVWARKDPVAGETPATQPAIPVPPPRKKRVAPLLRTVVPMTRPSLPAKPGAPKVVQEPL